MRALGLLVAGGFALLITSCGSGSGKVATNDVVPVSKYKEMLVGKWKADGNDQLVQAYEFGPDNKVKVAFHGMKEPVEGKYSWAGDRDLELEYQASDAAKKDYAAAVKAHKDPLRKQAEAGGPIGDAVRKSLEAIPDELPAKEKVKVIMSEKPHDLLIVTLEKGLTLNFDRAKGE
jgi:hypothetical protein